MSLSRLPRPFLYAFLIIALIGIFGVLIAFPLYGADFYYIFYRTARSILDNGVRLYEPDTSFGFYYPPHAIYYWLLVSLTPVVVANALHRFLTISFILGVVHLWKRFTTWDFLIVTMAIATSHTVDHWVRGQMDALAIFGLILAFVATKDRRPYLLGIGATIAVIKPTNMFLPLLLIAWAIREWHWRDIVKAAAIPLLTIASTFFILDMEWPLRYFNRAVNLRNNSFTNITIWQLAENAHLPTIIPIIFAAIFLLAMIKYRSLKPENFALAIVVSFLITPYAGGYHYVALIPVMMSLKSRKWAFLCWLLSFMPLLQIINESLSLAALLYPVAICAGILWQLAHPDEGAKVNADENMHEKKESDKAQELISAQG